MRYLTLLLCLIAMCGQAEPFVADAHTLFLASFEEDISRADYSIGPSRFNGNGARPVAGYFGQGLDLRLHELDPDFWQSSSAYTPRVDGWGFRSRGNVNPWQGTFECWFKPADPRRKKLLFSYNFLNAELSRAVPYPPRDSYTGFGLTLNMYAMKYIFPTVAGNYFEGEVAFATVPGFERYLDPEDWHHFAMTWSQGALYVYLDGRVLVSHDLTDQLGLVLLSNPVRYLSMSDMIIDELRISNVVRYEDEFEPIWREGERPDYAFSGNPAAEHLDHNLLTVPLPAVIPARPGPTTTVDVGGCSLQLRETDGAVANFSMNGQASQAGTYGLLLYEGLERDPLAPTALAALRQVHGEWRYDQLFGQVRASQILRTQEEGLVWEVTLTNEREQEVWLEPLLSLPVPINRVEECFDGMEARTKLQVPRHHDVYASTLPFVAAAGESRFFGMGIDPHVNLSEIVNQWVPVGQGGVLRQGTKLALSPGESFTLVFHLVAGEGDFGTLDAVDAFHARFPKLYRLRPDVTVYTYLPMTQYYAADKYVDFKRLGWAGNFWGHGPGHDKGDEIGMPEWWDNPELYDRPEYQRYTRRIEQLWGTIANVREYITAYFRRSYDNWYPVRRFHTCPDLTPEYIVNSVWPGYEPNEDVLTFGQYYKPMLNWYIVNEYNTPMGDHFRDHTRKFFRLTDGYTNGFINDMSHAGSLYRHNDPIAQRTHGRAFARDLGTFVRKALGRRQRYEVLEGFTDNGTVMTFWSDGGAFSYTLGAFSAGLAIEGAGMYKDLTGTANYVPYARYLVGEKPLSAMTHLNDDWIGYYLEPGAFTPPLLRDYYRFSGRQLMLWSIEHGVSLDPSSYLFGRQAELELQPIAVESTTLGRKLIPAATVADGLWVRRSGNNLDTLMVVGNRHPQAIETELVVHHRYFSGAPLFAPYFGGQATLGIGAEKTTLGPVTVEPRDVMAFKALALLETAAPASATTQLAGDGISLTVALALDLQGPSLLYPQAFEPLYSIHDMHLDGQPVRFRQGEPLSLSPGSHRLVYTCRTAALPFTAETWAHVDLIRDNLPNFCLVADSGVVYVVDEETRAETHQFGYEHGTAMMLNEFLEQYDSENGILGDLPPADFHDERPENYGGWVVSLRQDPLLRHGQVRIEPATRDIVVEGATQGEMRRAMVTFMRLVDRKYPHVGRFFPFRYRKQFWENNGQVPFDKWVIRQATREFFQAFDEDPLFLAKPILRREYEHLYADGNMDFAGKYELRQPPFIFEPTYGDDFVYGYSGPGKAWPREELHRRATPIKPPETDAANDNGKDQ